MKRVAKKSNVLNFPKRDDLFVYYIPKKSGADAFKVLVTSDNGLANRGIFKGDLLIYNTTLGESDLEIGDLYIAEHDKGSYPAIYNGKIKHTFAGVVTGFQRNLRRAGNE